MLQVCALKKKSQKSLCMLITPIAGPQSAWKLIFMLNNLQTIFLIFVEPL